MAPTLKSDWVPVLAEPAVETDPEAEPDLAGSSFLPQAARERTIAMARARDRNFFIFSFLHLMNLFVYCIYFSNRRSGKEQK